uniref:Uncharacterized protein n=1 Tax=Arundo donax TaxID=35708 RepID=A0A0A9G8J8_ARUDO
MAGTSAPNTAPAGPLSFQITPTPLRHPETPKLPARISCCRLSPAHRDRTRSHQSLPLPGRNPSAAVTATAQGREGAATTAVAAAAAAAAAPGGARQLGVEGMWL